MKPSPLKKKESASAQLPQPPQPSRLFGWIRDWRWGLFVLVLLLLILGLTVFWENRVEPKLGMHVTGETTDRSDAIPPVVERLSPVPLIFTAPKKEADELAAQILRVEEAQAASAEPLASLEAHLQGVETTQQKIFGILEKRQQIWALFLLLRQDIRAGMPFEAMWTLFEQVAKKELEHQPTWREAADTLRLLATQNLWPRWKLLHRLPPFTLAPAEPGSESGGEPGAAAQTSWLEKLKDFFQNLFVVKRTSDPAKGHNQGQGKGQDQALKQLNAFLEAGDLNAALALLSKLPLSSTPELEMWLKQAHATQRREAALLILQQALLALPPTLEKAE
jgi:hypothetical protein